jgi:hypothetical protein
MIDDAKEITIIALVLLIVGFVILTIVSHNEAIQPVVTPANTAVINNYYCESTPENIVDNQSTRVANHPDTYLWNGSRITPSPTPTLWNDTRRESVGLPADGIGNNCCKHCTPTPTPTITEACEFSWWCPMTEPHPQQGGERR